MRVLVINSGSSSVKFKLFVMPAATVLSEGMVERIGESAGRFILDGVARDGSWADHGQALGDVLGALQQGGFIANLGELAAIGHRVVHGGERFRRPVRVDQEVLEAISATVPLAPLHNPANLKGIGEALALCPDVPQVAVFDTAFHHSLPEHAYRYALPEVLYREHGVRRYGFHGTSHGFLARSAAAYLERPTRGLKLITLHLGNGASACAVDSGRSVDTSMGMTPMEGLVMGTRCGDLDPAIAFYLARNGVMDFTELEWMLNQDAGLKGLCGAGDMREVEGMARDGDPRAQLALEVFCYRVKKYIGAYAAALGGLDALVFSAGIGEHDARVRALSCQGLAFLGIELDPVRNEAVGAGPVTPIQRSGAPLPVLVIHTDEEREIALLSVEVVAGNHY